MSKHTNGFCRLSCCSRLLAFGQGIVQLHLLSSCKRLVIATLYSVQLLIYLVFGVSGGNVSVGNAFLFLNQGCLKISKLPHLLIEGRILMYLSADGGNLTLTFSIQAQLIQGCL